MSESTNIHPEFKRQIPREEKEQLLGQRGLVIWCYGLSGSGKSTLANALEKKLHQQGRLVCMLDGDNLRSGLNQNLGFTDEDREENIRRTAEVSKVLLQSGLIVLVSVITPREQLREQAKSIVGEKDFFDIYVEASFETCAKRDVKGLYEKAFKGEIKNFTGKESNFEPPKNPSLTINTESESLEESLEKLYKAVEERISNK